MIYHIAYRRDWEKAQTKGEYTVESLQNEGFIHMSSKNQVIQVANSFYKGQKDLVLLYIDEEKVSAHLKWEGKEELGEDFPHLYSPLSLQAVVKVVDFKPDENGWFSLL